MPKRSTPQPPAFVSRQMSSIDIDLAIKRLQKRISEVKGLDPMALAQDDPVRHKIQRSIRDTVSEIFGEASREARDFINPSLYHNPGPIRVFDEDNYDEFDKAKFYSSGCQKMVVDLEGLIEKLEERYEEIAAKEPSQGLLSTHEEEKIKDVFSREVFIVHGHDEAAKQEVARFLEQLNLRPIILHEQTNRGSTTIIEKLERHSNVPFAIILLTPDDIGAQASEPENTKARARQNVILELGYFLGRLGREKVCPLYKEGVDLPSDFSGILYTLLDRPGAWKLTLASELKELWDDIDLNRILRR